MIIMRRILIYISILGAFISAQEAHFNIHVSVEFISLELKHLDGFLYTVYMTDTLDPGDTTVCDSIDGVWIDNQSNIPVGIIVWAFDDSGFCAPDSIWRVDSLPGNDTCCVGISLYSSSRPPDIASALWLDEISQIIETPLIPGEDRYGYIYFVAPTNPADYGERQHRIMTIIGLAPE